MTDKDEGSHHNLQNERDTGEERGAWDGKGENNQA